MSTQPTIAVREAGHVDIDTLVDFNAALAKETENKSLEPDRLAKGVRAVFESPEKGFYLVAEVDGRVAGSLLITYEWSDWRDCTFWWIQSVYVLPEWRRKSIYRRMHSWVYDAARSRPDVCGIRLYVDRGNMAAQLTYQSLRMARSRYDLFEIDLTFIERK